MGRPPKLQRVDYFPHMCNHGGKTLYILDKKYGNDGYSVWFKLLEKLGSTVGHAVDFSRVDEWEVFQARCNVSSERCLQIMDHIALLEAIDRELWNAHRIVWCQNFVDNLAEVYRKRNSPLPKRPVVSVAETPVSGAEIPRDSKTPIVPVAETPVSGAESAARIGQDRIGQEREQCAREEEGSEPDPTPPRSSPCQGEAGRGEQGCLFENFWETFRRSMPLRNGKFHDEEECRVYAAKQPAKWPLWIAGVKNYKASREVADGAVMHAMKFLSKAYLNWQTPEVPDDLPEPDYSWREEADRNEAARLAFEAKVSVGEVILCPRDRLPHEGLEEYEQKKNAGKLPMIPVEEKSV